MAKGSFNRYAGDAPIAWSGEVEPGDEVAAGAVAAMGFRASARAGTTGGDRRRQGWDEAIFRPPRD